MSRDCLGGGGPGGSRSDLALSKRYADRSDGLDTLQRRARQDNPSDWIQLNVAAAKALNLHFSRENVYMLSLKPTYGNLKIHYTIPWKKMCFAIVS